jgi:hypothetical protein
MLSNLNIVKCQHDATGEKSILDLRDLPVKLQVHPKYCIKLPLGYVHEVHMEHKWFVFRLGTHPKVFHYVYANIPKSKNSEIQNMLVPRILAGEGTLNLNMN